MTERPDETPGTDPTQGQSGQGDMPPGHGPPGPTQPGGYGATTGHDQPPGWGSGQVPGYGAQPGYPPPGYGYGPPGYGRPPGGGDDRTWAMFAHLGLLLGGFVLGPLAPLVPMIIYLTKRDESSFVKHHGAQALNLGLTELIVMVAGFILGMVTLGFGFILTGPLMLAYAITALVFMILATVAANRGEWYRYPSWLAWPMIK